MSYHHLTIAEREDVRVLLEQGMSQRFIARHLGRNPATICREINRNQVSSTPYRAHEAQDRYLRVRQDCKSAKKVLRPELYPHIVIGLELYWAPEQIIGRLQLPISTSTIYRALWNGLLPQTVVQKLRRGGHRSKGSAETRGKMSGCISIEERPAIAAQRQRPGDWEGDTVCGTHGTGHILTLVDRATSFLVASKMKNRMAETVLRTMSSNLAGLCCHTITLDNGKEFAKFKDIQSNLDTKVYFAHPHSPWERPINEHTNGLLRQFFPKNTSFADVTEEQVEIAVDLLNNRPRKRLHWKTPAEVFANACCT